MGVNDNGQQLALARFDFTGGADRGSQLLLYPRCLVHRGEQHLETMLLAHIAAIRVSFDRDRRRLGWGIACVVIALFLLMLSAPLGMLAHSAAQDMAASAQGVARALYSFFRFVELTAAVLPAVALAAAIGGAALAVFGWRGSTTLTLSLGCSERRYRVRGRDTLLLDFAQLAAERLMALPR
jgi:hypothetical protein